MNNPLISIITVCFNAAGTLEKTIQSVLAQTYTPIEYIIIDGASKDDTLNIIKKYEHKINYWISEPDKGLYDAMNKGIKAATGKYLFFLNADDKFAANDILAKMMACENNADVYYGDVMMVDNNDTKIGLRSRITPHKIPARLTWKSLKTGMVVSHQAFLVKKSITPLYNTTYKIAADIDWMINVLKAATKICNTNHIVAEFRMGGTSKQRQKLAWKERYKIFNKHYGSINNLFNHIYITSRYLITKPFQKHL